MTMLANKLNYDREVIRVWFCNKRQALKNTIKKFKQGGNGSLDQSGLEGSMSPSSPNQSINNSTSQQNFQTTPNNASSIQQSIVSVATSSASASPSTKTVITLNCTNQTNQTAAQVTSATSSTSSSSPSSSSQQQQNSVATTTLKIENIGNTNGDQEQLIS